MALQRTKEEENGRTAAGRKAPRLAMANAERRRNMVCCGIDGSGEYSFEFVKQQQQQQLALQVLCRELVCRMIGSWRPDLT